MVLSLDHFLILKVPWASVFLSVNWGQWVSRFLESPGASGLLLKGWLRSQHLLRGRGADGEATGLADAPAPGSSSWSQAGRRLGVGTRWGYLGVSGSWPGRGLASAGRHPLPRGTEVSSGPRPPTQRCPWRGHLTPFSRCTWLLCRGLPCFGALSYLGVLLCPAPNTPRQGCLHLDPSRVVQCTAPHGGGGPSPTPRLPDWLPQRGSGPGMEGGGPHGARKPERAFAQWLRVCVCPCVTAWGEQDCPLSGWPWGQALCTSSLRAPCPHPPQEQVLVTSWSHGWHSTPALSVK